MSGGKNRLLGVLRALPAAVVLLTGAAVIAAERDEELAHRLEAVVHVHAEVPSEARTAAYLGTARDGSGVVIDDAGLIITIGYLITEAMGAEITTADGKISRADVVGLDLVSGLGLLRAAEVLPVKPMSIGTAQELAEKTPVVVAGSGGIGAAQRRSSSRAEPSPGIGNTCWMTRSSPRRIACRDEPRPTVARPGPSRRNPRPLGAGLWLVHRRLRHTGPEGGEGAARRAVIGKVVSIA
jgi:hypothetical protein